MVILKLVTTVALTFHKKRKLKEKKWKEHPFLNEKGIELIKRFNPARTSLGMGRYAPYKDYGEDLWRIGYGSKKLGKSYLRPDDIATEEEIDIQLEEDLKIFSDLVSQYVFVPLNKNRKAAILSFAFSIGISSLKTCRLLELINTHATKTAIIREWSPFINRLWCSGGDLMVAQRRTELDMYLAPDKTIPTFVPHRCHAKRCLLNLPETYTGAPNQVKAIEYLEKKLLQWDPSQEVVRRFFRYWNENPRSLGSPKRQQDLD